MRTFLAIAVLGGGVAHATVGSALRIADVAPFFWRCVADRNSAAAPASSRACCRTRPPEGCSACRR